MVSLVEVTSGIFHKASPASSSTHFPFPFWTFIELITYIRHFTIQHHNNNTFLGMCALFTKCPVRPFANTDSNFFVPSQRTAEDGDTIKTHWYKCVHAKDVALMVCCVVYSHEVISESLWLHRLYPPGWALLSTGFPSKNTGVGCCFLLQKIFLTQEWNRHLLLGSQVLYHWVTWEAQPLSLIADALQK